MQRRRRTVPLLLAVLALVLVATQANALPSGPSQQSIDEAKQRVGQLDSQLGDARAQAKEAEQQVAAVEQRLAEASAALEKSEAHAEEADKAAAAARADAKAANERLSASEAALADNREQLFAFARDSYKYGPGISTPAVAMIENLSNVDGPTGVADTLHVLEIALGDKTTLVDEAHRLVEQTARLAKEASDARHNAEVQLAASIAARDDAAALHAQVLALMDEAEQALEHQRQVVEETSSALSQAKDHVATLEEQKRAAERAAAAARAAAARAAAARAAARSGRIEAVPAGGGLVTVGGITVAAALAPNLEALLKAARADGIVLGGSGYRSVNVTKRLRIINGCPDVYSSPSWTCRVPTARPGSSMHERGLAIDFTWRGRTICYPLPPGRCHGNAAFDWLRANAGRYGLYGLSSESWHWSTTGT